MAREVDEWVGNVAACVMVTCAFLRGGTETSRYLCIPGEKIDGAGTWWGAGRVLCFVPKGAFSSWHGETSHEGW